MTTELHEIPESTALAAHEPPPDNPVAMLSVALARGTDPAKLEKLMDLADRWKAQQAAAEFAAALNDCQREMPCIVKDRVNTFLSNARYASLENVHSTIRPVYTQHGFSLSFGTEESKLADHLRVVCDVRHTGGHKERYGLDIPVDGAGMKGGSNKSGAQAIGSSISYARRYLETMIFALTIANEDVDGNANLDTITEAEALNIEDQLIDKGVVPERFVDWLKTAGVCIGEPAVKNIAQKHLPKVLDMLARRKKGAGAK
jgi:hypothetical protein